MASNTDEHGSDVWIFGYGSLIWKPPPHYESCVQGYIKSYVRRFWQASEDHRGTPESPGRVVTLINYEEYNSLVKESSRQGEEDHHNADVDTGEEKVDAETRVYGTAYKIPATHVESVLAYLQIREINGYTIQHTTFYPAPEGTQSDQVENVKCIIYIGLPTSPQFIGPEHPQVTAEIIAESRGPSGPNAEYLFELAKAVEDVPAPTRITDAYIVDLVARVRRILH